MTPKPALPVEAINIQTSLGFEQKYFENLKLCDSNVEAYELTEQLYEYYYGRRKYSNFASFREVINRRMRKR